MVSVHHITISRKFLIRAIGTCPANFTRFSTNMMEAIQLSEVPLSLALIRPKPYLAFA